MVADPRFADYAIYVLQPHGRRRRREGARAVAEDRARRPEGGDRRRAGRAPLGEHLAAARTDAPRSGARHGRRHRHRQDRRSGRRHRAQVGLRGRAGRRRSGCWPRPCSRPPPACSRRRSPRPQAACTMRSRPTAPCRRRCGGPPLMGTISAAGPRAASVLVAMLGGDDADGRQAAIARIGDVIPQDGIGPVCDLLPRLPADAQVQVLAALSRYPASRVRPAALQAARRDSPDEVRMAALKVLEAAGDASTVPFLVETAASEAKGPVQDAARRALGRASRARGRRRHRRRAEAAGLDAAAGGAAEGRRRPAHLPGEAGRRRRRWPRRPQACASRR